MRILGRAGELVEATATSQASICRIQQFFAQEQFRESWPWRHWVAQPKVAQAINRRITGLPTRTVLQALADLLPRHGMALPVGKTAILGCGRGRLERRLYRHGIVRAVTGFDPAERSKLDPYCPVRNITGKYPPILMVHGTKDTDVPYEQSAQMAKELGRKGVAHELMTVKDAGHGLAGAKPSVVAETHERVLAFLKKHLR